MVAKFDIDNKELFDLLQSAKAVLKTAREKLCEEFCHLGGHCKECIEIDMVLARLNAPKLFHPLGLTDQSKSQQVPRDSGVE